MGLFHDKCEALVDKATGKALSGEALAEAKKIYDAGVFGRESRLAEHGWAVCGHSVSKKARVCSKCGQRAPGGWIKCPVCHKWIGNESKFCPHCNHALYPEERIDLAGGVWAREPGGFAQRFEIEDGASILKQGLHIQEGTVAVMLDSGKVCGVLKPGRHEPAGTLRNINWFFNPPVRSVLMVEQGDVVFKLNFDDFSSADGYKLKMFAEVTIRFVPSKAVEFIENVMKDNRSFSSDKLSDWLINEIEYAAKNLCTKTTIEDLVLDPNRRELFEDELSHTIKELFARSGLELIRVGYIDFQSPQYEVVRRQHEDFEKARKQFEFDQKMMEFAASQEVVAITDELERIKRNNKAEMGKIDEANQFSEYTAKKELELSEYFEQLAQEKQISEEDRRVEWEIIRKVADGKITAEEAKQELAVVQQGHLKRMTNLANEQEYQFASDKFTRETQIANAEHKAKLNDFERTEKLRDKENEIAIYETDVVGRARAEANAEVYRLEQYKLKDQARRIDIETDKLEIDKEIYEAEKWQKIRTEKEVHEAEMEAKRINMRKGLSALELASIASDPDARAQFIELAKMSASKDLTTEQILASQVGNSSSTNAVEAIKAVMAAKDETSARLLEELKKLHDTDHARNDETVKNIMEMFKHATTLQERTATTAAGRVDHHEHHHDQQIIK